MAKPRTHKIIHLIWEDAWASSSQWTLDEIKKEKQFLCHSAGFVVYEDSHRIVLAEEYQLDKSEYRRVHCIPKSLVRKRT